MNCLTILFLRGAFRYAKVFSSEGEITENQSIADLTLDFEEFQKFFFALRQYFLYCQVSNKQNTLGSTYLDHFNDITYEISIV